MRITARDNLIISHSEYEIELDQIVQTAVVNKILLTTLSYQLPNQSQGLLVVANLPADKAPSGLRLAPHSQTLAQCMSGYRLMHLITHAKFSCHNHSYHKYLYCNILK